MNTTSAARSSRLAATRPSARDRLARHLLFRLLDQIEHSGLEVKDAGEARSFGTQDPESGPATIVRVHEPSAYSSIAFGGSVGAGQSYMDGAWSTNDLPAAIGVLARNHAVLSRWRKGPARLAEIAGRIQGLSRKNTLRGSRENVGAHYDLSNDFFRLFLDEKMMYSSAYFERAGASLDEASVAKLDRICHKLRLGPSDHLLEIGTGWGGLAIHAAREYGCRVTTTTISREQHDFAQSAIRQAGLDDRIRLLQQDYRALQGRYSKLVSVEMIEAVGAEYLDLFFRRCDQLLEDDGIMLLQAITIDDREYERAARTVDFIKHFIFPGTCLPSVHRMSKSLVEETQLRVLDLEDLTGHYATTLLHWRERFQRREAELERLGFDQRFRRMWEFYFAYCEAGFRERRIGDVQMLLAKPGYRSSSGLLPAGDEVSS